MKHITSIFQKIYVPDQTLLEIKNARNLKKIFFLVAASVSIPFFLGFGIFQLLISGFQAAWADLFVAGILSAIFWIARKQKVNGIIYRLSLAVVSILFLVNVITGDAGGASILWLYVYPMAVFSLLGRKEGIYWVFIFFIPIITIMTYGLGSNVHDYSAEFRLRFTCSIVIVSFFAWLYETLFHFFHTRLEDQKRELEEKAEKIRTLTGLIPICSYCKNVRTDSGYWQTVEHYISRHSDAQFSHGICDDCLEEIDPETYKELIEEGKIKPGDEQKIRSYSKKNT